MLAFENQRAAYFWVREHWKRRKTVFAAQKTPVISQSKRGGRHQHPSQSAHLQPSAHPPFARHA